MESTDSSAGSPRQHTPNLPPGFRFHPTDEELVVHYLKKKAASAPLPVAIIAEVDLYKFDPWELPAKATFGEQEWYFFSPRDRKYPNGARPNRAATSGYWKATGTDKPVLSSGGGGKVGVKKALVFYGGKPPKGIKTNWIMHEYRLADHNRPSHRPPYHDPSNKRNSLRLDDWVLCRIYKKTSNAASRAMDHHPQPHHLLHHHHVSLMKDDVYEAGPTDHSHNSNLMMSVMMGPQSISNKPPMTEKSASTMMSFHDHQLFDGMLSSNSEEVNAAPSSSLASLLSQPGLHQNPVLGTNLGAGDGIFQERPFPLPGMNWYS